MDYDKTEMARGYDSGRSYSSEQLDRWLNVISDSLGVNPVGQILDLGCGTGRYSNALANHLRALVVGVEPSLKMLSEARRKLGDRVSLVRGRGESLPLLCGSVDMVFISMVFHHFEDPRAAVRECRRVLKPRGVVCLRAGTCEQIEDYAYVPFFPEARPVLARTLTTRTAIESTFLDEGFQMDRHIVVPSEAAQSWRDYAERLAHRADSILVQLPDADFNRGLNALSDFATAAPAGPVVEPVDFFAFRSG